MTIRRITFHATILLAFCAAIGFGWHTFTALTIVRAQQNSAPPPPPAESQPAQQQGASAQAQGPALKAETREVRVDVLVTDKKGEYITDLTQKDFRVYEDNKEQPVNSFSFGADPNAPVKNQRHYLVLFFDTTSMDLSD